MIKSNNEKPKSSESKEDKKPADSDTKKNEGYKGNNPGGKKSKS